jgi:hypothetical protein
MAVADTHRSTIARLKNEEAALRSALVRHETDKARALADERRYMDSADRASSSTRRMHLSTAEQFRKRALEASRKAADVTQKLSRNATAQATATRNLRSAERSEQQALDRKAFQRRQREVQHARDIARLSTPQVRYVHIRPPQQEKLRVLYMTANPALDLRTEIEVRQVQLALRGAKYRDLVDVQLRPAATIQDLVDGLNDVRPHIVHFSGHGSSAAVQFDSGEAGEDGSSVDFTLLAEALGATDESPTLLVLNACDTLDGAALILPAVPVIVGMSSAIVDNAATVFAQQFYAAVASGQSVGAALRQARLKLKVALHDDVASQLPQHVARADVDIDGLILVRVPA